MSALDHARSCLPSFWCPSTGYIPDGVRTRMAAGITASPLKSLSSASSGSTYIFMYNNKEQVCLILVLQYLWTLMQSSDALLDN